MNARILIASAAMLAAGSGCMAPKGDTPAEKRQFVNDMSREALTQLYAVRPQAKREIEGAAGYGVVAQIATGTGIGGGGSGYGVVVNNDTGVRSYVRMIQLSGGIGFGIKNLRVIFVFHNHDALRKFVTEGWEVGTEAQAAALLDHKGVGATASGTLTGGISAYQITKDGLYLRAAIHTKKFFPDTELNDE